MITKAKEMKADNDVDYYFDGEGAGALAYYGKGSGKEPGFWQGHGARVLGIEGQPVTEVQVRALFDGLDPTTGTSLSESQLEIRSYDVSVSAPKSVSIAMAVPELRHAFEAAHDAAVRVAAAYLEDALCRVRRREAGEQHALPAGAVVAPFVHRVSRDGDPHLHTHLLLFALAVHEGRWSALWGKPIQILRPVGILYQAELRHRLTALGYGWAELGNGAGEIEGVPAGLASLFSKRSDAIHRHLADSGRSGKTATDRAVLSTRTACRMPVDPSTGKPLSLEQLTEQWTEEGRAAGYDLKEVYEHAQSHSSVELDTEALVQGLLGPTGLTEIATTVTFDRVVMAIAEAMPSMAADRALMAASHLASHPAIRTALSGTKMTTAELLAVEAEIGCLANEPYNGQSVLIEGTARPLLRDKNLDDEMAGAALELLTSSKRVTVLTGPAGSAKTTVIAACASIWRGRDTYAHGATLAALLADSLQGHHAIESSTVASLLQGGKKLPSGTVLIVEEASMVGSRALLRLISLAREAGGRVVLVGDSSQLPEIEAAGGAFAVLAERPDAIQLRSVVRQRDEAERGLLNKLRGGEYAPYLDWADRCRRLHAPQEMEEVIEQMALEYVRHIWADGFFSTLLIARSWGQLHVLNRRVRELLWDEEDPILIGPAVWFREHSLQIMKGDRLLLRRNDYPLRLMNGMVGTVKAVVVSDGVELRLDDGATVRVPRSYIDSDTTDGRPAVAYAYATTAHRAQGMTAERTLALIRGDESRQWAYVALSRARGSTTIWTLKDPADRAKTSREILAGVLERSEAQETATTQVLPAVLDEHLDADAAWDEADALWGLLAADRSQVIAEAADSLRGEDDASYGIQLALSLEAWRRQETAVLPRWKAVMARLEDVAPLRYDDALEDWLEIWADILSKPLFAIVDDARTAVSLGASGAASPLALPVLAPRSPADVEIILTQDALKFGDPAA